MSQQHDPDHPASNKTGDRYQLFGEITRGGMGAILRARDVDLGRDLAVKVLLRKHANRPEMARRFIEEAQITAQLQHPGVAPVYNIGRFGELPFFTIKLVKGQTLAVLLAERTGFFSARFANFVAWKVAGRGLSWDGRQASGRVRPDSWLK
jgi:serine/threonine protein kinase